jgi:hypothetical protein
VVINMARIALINNGSVINVTLADLAFAQGLPGYDVAVDISARPEIGIGWVYAAGVFTAPLPPTPPIPQSVTMRQARLALLAHGLLGNVAAAINSLPEPAKSQAHIEWEYSNALERGNTFVATLGAALGLNASALDALFIEAAQL